MSVSWVIIPSSIVACGATYAVGANDAANALGTAYGSKTLSMRSALILGSVCEFLGILALGSIVSSTLRTGIIDVSSMSAPLFVIGMFSALCAAFVWLLFATLFGFPVSTTHTIVAGIFAFGVFEAGIAAINTISVVLISVSWIVSPLAGFFVGWLVHGVLWFVIFKWRRFSIERKSEVCFEIAAGVTLGFMSLLILVGVWKSVGLPLPVLIVVPFVVMGLVWGLTHFFVLPWWKTNKAVLGPRVASVLMWGHDADEVKEEPDIANAKGDLDANTTTNDEETVPNEVTGLVKEAARLQAKSEAQNLYQSLLVASAALVAFSHSANDIANSVAPFVVCYEYATTSNLDTNFKAPLWIYIVAGCFLVLGLLTLGFVVMKTIGQKITVLSPMAAFAAQLSGSCVVIAATLAGMPVSTTHVIVGAITGVGVSVEGLKAINVKTIGKILLGWSVTIVAGAGLTLAFYAPLRLTAMGTNSTNVTNFFF